MRRENPELKPFSDSILRNVIKESNEQIYRDMLEYRDGIELPESLGYCFIGTCPKKIAVNIDYKVSHDHALKIEHRNWESDNYLAKIFYTNYETKYRFKFSDLWTFSAGRNFKRSVGRIYPTCWKKYIQVDHTLKISRLFRKEKMRVSKILKTELLLATYDEFAGF